MFEGLWVGAAERLARAVQGGWREVGGRWAIRMKCTIYDEEGMWREMERLLGLGNLFPVW